MIHLFVQHIHTEYPAHAPALFQAWKSCGGQIQSLCLLVEFTFLCGERVNKDITGQGGQGVTCSEEKMKQLKGTEWLGGLL